MRGNRSIYTSLFEDQTVLNTTPTTERKGRSEMLILRRNEALICRYYYYVRLQAFQYERALKTLANEFFIQERTIVDMLAKNSGILKELRASDPTVKYFREKYAWMRWD
ncbi:hypothetical protein F0L74_05995 [Chitinophaga agrisoli]|uniref:Uncharacterized protein n=1 Tax=Chitinophaga agrisoli TaxID=2607653 RepID=A0A5B2W3S6_9BACT|nr:hypothetical protein [Chitinophaga agrisoli]KAA2245508.1 hypothetical protein F0L74_05995 [Chitinophaga agrisoli]